MASVTMRGVEKLYGPIKVIHGIDVEIGDEEFVVLVGPSGCGKSTLLRMIAGLEEISAGQIDIGGRVVNDVTPRDRDVAMVFQNYALYPHKTVFDNMAFGLKLRGADKAVIGERVRRAADILGLADLLDRYPRQLSGGQRQRVAMGRAIVRDPQVFLFDEPLSNLDAKLRVQMRLEIKKLQRQLGTTSIYVTHDQVEAMTLADRLIVMNAGRAEQIGEIVGDDARDIARERRRPAIEFVDRHLVGRGGHDDLRLVDDRRDRHRTHRDRERRRRRPGRGRAAQRVELRRRRRGAGGDDRREHAQHEGRNEAMHHLASVLPRMSASGWRSR